MNEPRYLTLLAPVAAVLLAVPLARDVPRAAMGLACDRAHGRGARLDPQARPLPLVRDGRPVPADVEPAIRTLEQRHATRVLAPYWVAYRLTFESDRRVIATAESPIRGDVDDRLVRSSPHPARVYVRGETEEPKARVRLLRAGYERLVRGGWVVYVWPRAGSIGSS